MWKKIGQWAAKILVWAIQNQDEVKGLVADAIALKDKAKTEVNQ